MICDIFCVDGFLCMLHLDIVHMLSAYVHVIHTLSGYMHIMRTLFAVVLDIFLPNRQCQCHPYVIASTLYISYYVQQYTDDIDNMHVCRQCAETKLWIIRYMRSGKDDKQMMCTCMCGQLANDMDNVCLCRQCAETKL